MAKYTFKQHIPNFCDGFTKKVFGANSITHLLTHPHIAHLRKVKGFHCFAYSYYEGDDHVKLMGMYKNSTPEPEDKNKYQYFVLGFIKGCDGVTISKAGLENYRDLI